MTRKEIIKKMALQKVLNGRVIASDILMKSCMAALVDGVTIQEWSHSFEPRSPYLHEPEVREFYYKIELLGDGGINTTVKEMENSSNGEILRIILGIHVAGISSIERCSHLKHSLSLPLNKVNLNGLEFPRSI